MTTPMPTAGDLTDPSYWAARQQGHECAPTPAEEPEWFSVVGPHLHAHSGQRLLEVGCAPGDVSAFICSRISLVPEGVEFSPSADLYLQTMARSGIHNARLHRCDVREFRPTEPYDIVASFGLVEHFDDPQVILDEHDRLLRPGGLCVVVIPSFRGIQFAYHYLFDRTDLRRHNIASMDPDVFRRFAGRRSHHVLELRHVGRLRFFNVDLGGGFVRRWARRIGSRAVRDAARLLGPTLPEGHPFLAPWLVYVARKPDAAGSATKRENSFS